MNNNKNLLDRAKELRGQAARARRLANAQTARSEIERLEWYASQTEAAAAELEGQALAPKAANGCETLP